ncbi:malto-oligosyltrehalose trehalohydrolase [Spirosoma utsteinense]|uniref:Malto-oligosyltrehalose trehalohydrolase n=1 Tax=Spirosoma utsteinense TaxID=2585773 RepID=A0ABR6W8B2_9BACT|nr:malto-oligosyltrehalose trehalohydrolase [Spirosoma utsteinense]MBC3785853.1 maltooligosyltrehalose trehalohydrolase [Spirosoma utsteinense]MBC3792025.1 maltooligosyltrehalose trehalohydrolase [Spirosoma utsteinense]
MTTTTLTHRTLGITFTPDGLAQVCVWAPFAQDAALYLVDKDQQLPLSTNGSGYWRTTTRQLQPGDTYRFRLNGSTDLPDPVSMAQPDGVHGPSQAVDVSTFVWTDSAWQNHSLDDYILYELHTGTFSPAGTFTGIEERLAHLVDLGINAIEIMPVAQFPGTRNWGYDGVFPFAVQHSYGGAAGLQQLVDAAHRHGLAVVLDVVYNHIGPEGNYLPAYGPYFTDRYHTPWGDALDFDGEHSASVRQYFVENALMWFRDFHIDALRLDAVHAIYDHSPVHILREIREQADALSTQTGRQHYLIIESDLNDTRYIESITNNGYGMDGQWNDEFHHALRVAAGGERNGYYADYDGIRHLAKSYKDAYVYDGLYMPRRDSIVGSPTTTHAGRQFVVFSQNHDQIGNRMLGERPGQLVSFAMQKLMAGAVLTSPYLPMLFMGEEWGESNPFLYFVSHSDPTLVEAVRQGRQAEFAAFHSTLDAPDPQDENTFQQSKLGWSLLVQEPHQTLFRYYKTLLLLRKQSVLRAPDRTALTVVVDEDQQTLTLHRRHDHQRIVCLMNFSGDVKSMSLPEQDQPWQKLLDSADPVWLGPAAAPLVITGSTPISLQPESILVYVAGELL